MMDWSAPAHPIFIIIAAGTLVGVFLRGAAHKLSDFNGFAFTVAEYRILPTGLAVPVAGLLLASEIAVMLGLVLPQTRAMAAFGAAVLLAIYGVAIAVNLVRGRERIDCGCGGAGNGLSWFQVLRNAALAGFALVAAQLAAVPVGPWDWVAAFAGIAAFWLLLIGAEKLAENWSYLVVADKTGHHHEAEMH